MRISEIAESAGVSVPTVRFYEKRGLIPDPPRTSAGYRVYDRATVDRLRFIKQAQGLGFTLDEIRELLAMRIHPESACAEIKAQAENKIAQVAVKIRRLRALKQALDRLVTSCELERQTSDCPILEVLEGGRDA